MKPNSLTTGLISTSEHYPDLHRVTGCFQVLSFHQKTGLKDRVVAFKISDGVFKTKANAVGKAYDDFGLNRIQTWSIVELNMLIKSGKILVLDPIRVLHKKVGKMIGCPRNVGEEASPESSSAWQQDWILNCSQAEEDCNEDQQAQEQPEKKDSKIQKSTQIQLKQTEIVKEIIEEPPQISKMPVLSSLKLLQLLGDQPEPDEASQNQQTMMFREERTEKETGNEKGNSKFSFLDDELFSEEDQKQESCRSPPHTDQLQDKNFIAFDQIYQNLGRVNVRGRVIAKSILFERKITNYKTKPSFEFFLVDRAGMTLQCRYLGSEIYDWLQESQIYEFYGGKIQRSNQSKAKSKRRCLFSLILDSNSNVQPATSTSNLPFCTDAFIPLSAMASILHNSFVDTVGIVKQSQEMSINQRRKKRLITLIDPLCNSQIELGIFSQLSLERGQIYLFYNFKVNQYQGKLSLIESFKSVVRNQQQSPSSAPLQEWLRHNSYSEWRPRLNFKQCTIKQLKALEKIKLQNHRHPIQIRLLCYMLFSKRKDIIYFSCDVCKKKVRILGPDYYCDKCQANVHPLPRFILNARLIDSTGSMFITFFDQDASFLLGTSAQQLFSCNRVNQAGAILDRMTHSAWKLDLQGQISVFREQKRVKYKVRGVGSGACEQSCASILQRIGKYLDV